MRGGKFLGSYLHQLDEKGRLSLPASYRRDAAEQRFVLVQPYPPALALYPEVEWAAVEERLQDVMKSESGRLYVLKVMSSAVEVVPDAQGRILVPSNLREAAGLDGQALLVGAINKIEVWNPAQFEQAVSASAPQFGDYTSQIFR
jgi:MraZ protein